VPPPFFFFPLIHSPPRPFFGRVGSFYVGDDTNSPLGTSSLTFTFTFLVHSFFPSGCRCNDEFFSDPRFFFFLVSHNPVEVSFRLFPRTLRTLVFYPPPFFSLAKGPFDDVVVVLLPLVFFLRLGVSITCCLFSRFTGWWRGLFGPIFDLEVFLRFLHDSIPKSGGVIRFWAPPIVSCLSRL